MVTLPLSTRRRFLHHLALLTAGAAALPAVNLLAAGRNADCPEQLWKRFCSLHKGKPYRQNILQADGAQIQPSTGHTHRTGEAIYFPEEQILAQPTWVFWGAERKPADVIITFFDDAEKKKLRRINRFELEALNLLCQQTTLQTSQAAGATLLQQLINDRKHLVIKTTVSKHSVSLSAFHRRTEARIKKTIHYTT